MFGALSKFGSNLKQAGKNYFDPHGTGPVGELSQGLGITKAAAPAAASPVMGPLAAISAVANATGATQRIDQQPASAPTPIAQPTMFDPSTAQPAPAAPDPRQQMFRRRPVNDDDGGQEYGGLV